MKFNYGTQYYRYPTPESKYWDTDLAQIKKIGMNYIQVRPQWRSHERIEGKYEWDDIDKLFELCKKHKLKVVFKFLLECGPEWIFDKYKAYRVSPDNQIITPYSDGAFYIGGMIPCFDNPEVRSKAVEFVKNAVKRYWQSEELLLWNVWNEPRNRPFAECACKHSVIDFQKWLKNKYQKIENLNEHLGLAETSFESIKPPHNYYNYTTVDVWKKWARSRIAERLSLVVNAIKEIDKKNIISTHVGMSSMVQDILNDGSDDYLNSNEVDIYGTSYVHWVGEFESFRKIKRKASFAYNDWKQNQFIYSMNTDWIRSLKKNFWVNEFYTNEWDAHSRDFTQDDIKFRLYEALGNGAKGICFWQYRPEKLCNESGITGIINPDNTETARYKEINKFQDFLDKNDQWLSDYAKVKGDIAIVYDVESDLISRLEETDSSNQFNFTSYRYKNSLKGYYSMLWRSGISVDFVSSHDFRKIKEYSAIILPYMPRITEEHSKTIQQYVANGGIVFADPGLGSRDDKNWLNDILPPFGLDSMFNLKHFYSDIKEGELNTKIVVNNYYKGKAVYFNDYPGEKHFLHSEFNFKKIVTLIKKIIGFKERYTTSGLVISKFGKCKNGNVIFLLNYENKKVSVDLIEKNKKIILNPREIKVYLNQSPICTS